jgi:hypothetical protein
LNGQIMTLCLFVYPLTLCIVNLKTIKKQNNSQLIVSGYIDFLFFLSFGQQRKTVITWMNSKKQKKSQQTQFLSITCISYYFFFKWNLMVIRIEIKWKGVNIVYYAKNNKYDQVSCDSKMDESNYWNVMP